MAVTKKERRAVADAVCGLMPELSRIHRLIHGNPEPPFNEHKAVDALCAFLQSEGFHVRRGIAGLETSFRADAGGAGKGPRAAFVCEYDALPGLDHASGRSIAAAASAGAAAALHRLCPGLAVTAAGTPGVETGAGKTPMIEAGAFEGIDFAMMVHPSSRLQAVNPSLGMVRRVYTFHGRAAHAAAHPEDGINALDAAVNFYNGVSAMRQHVTDDVCIHLVITEGGTDVNVIPDRARVLCAVRALDPDALDELAKKVDAAAKGAARAAGARLGIESTGRSIMPLKANRALAGAFEQEVRAFGLELDQGPGDGYTGSDIGNLSRLMPVILPSLPVSRPGEAGIYTPGFEKKAGGKKGKEAVRLGATLLASTTLSVFRDRGLFNRMKREFERGGRDGA